MNNGKITDKAESMLQHANELLDTYERKARTNYSTDDVRLAISDILIGLTTAIRVLDTDPRRRAMDELIGATNTMLQRNAK